MSSLIILGNKNKFTFYHAVVSAGEKSKELFNGEPIEQIYVIHSMESLDTFFADSDEECGLSARLQHYGFSADQFIHRVVDTSAGDYSTFLKHIKNILISMKDSGQSQHLIIDVTNGTTNMKSILSVVSYILDINYVFFIDSSSMFQELGSIRDKYLEPAQVSKYYTQSIPNKTIDAFAYLNLTEVTRYKERINNLSNTYRVFPAPYNNTMFFQNNLLTAIQIKLNNDKSRKDESIYRIASTAIASSVEDMIGNFLKSKLQLNPDGKTLGWKLHKLQDAMENHAAPGFDFEFLSEFNHFMLYLRNSTVHHSGKLSISERFKASLSIQMSLIFLDYYSKVVFESFIQSGNHTAEKEDNTLFLETPPKYYGLDGDNTGRKIEALLAENAPRATIMEVSSSIAEAKNEVKNYITNKHGTIIFAEGDDILFEGSFTQEQLQRMQSIYCSKSHGITCSISCGNTFREVFLAMKLAKAERNAIREVSLTSDAT